MPTIKCRTCHTSMVVDRCESSQQAITCWHQCPICKQVRLTSERDSTARQTASVADEDIIEPDLTVGEGYVLL